MRLPIPLVPIAILVRFERRPLGPLRPQITVRRLMIAIALLAPGLAWIGSRMAIENRRLYYLTQATSHESVANANEGRIIRLVAMRGDLDVPSPGPGSGVIDIRTILKWEREDEKHPTAKAIVREFRALRYHLRLASKYRVGARRPWLPIEPDLPPP